MLEKKILGILISTGESMDIDYISSLVNQEKELTLSILNKLKKEGKVNGKRKFRASSTYNV
jgi:hypothetical protein